MLAVAVAPDLGTTTIKAGLLAADGGPHGIARCVPFAGVYVLPQSEAGLVGAARLAAGMPTVVEHGVEKIAIIRAPSKLSEKYARWKVWLDGLLS